MRNYDDRVKNSFEFIIKVETKTHPGEVHIKRPNHTEMTAYFRRSPGSWSSVMGWPLHETLSAAVELLHNRMFQESIV